MRNRPKTTTPNTGAAPKPMSASVALALQEAGASSQSAREAAAEIAALETRLTRLEAALERMARAFGLAIALTGVVLVLVFFG